ncbi:hypothetical protein [Paludibaculum fermentans]|uniref:hypothetical protein n=1 Tax=Paludibaculum fermentans TaxID=1473598 RepID=UPI003EB8827C
MRSLTFAICVCIASALPSSGQRISFGIVGGTNITNSFPPFESRYAGDATGNPPSLFQHLTGPRAFIFGAMVEGRIGRDFSVELNVLHRPMKAAVVYTQFLPDGTTQSYRNEMTAVRAWEFPLLLKYTLPKTAFSGRLRPFIEAGPSFRTQEDAAGAEPSQYGFTAGAGLAYHWRRLKLSPSLRYTRWARESIYPRYATKPDQLEFLTSVSYETDPGSRRVGSRMLEIGALVGYPVTQGFREVPFLVRPITERTRYLVGISTQANLTRRLAVEIDGIYKPLRSGESTSDPWRFMVITWQFPVLAKYRLTTSKWSPIVEGGPSFRLAGNLNGYNPSHYGATVGAGAETRTHGMHLSPVVRYTRWALDVSPYSGGPTNQRTNQNAVELVFGISF